MKPLFLFLLCLIFWQLLRFDTALAEVAQRAQGICHQSVPAHQYQKLTAAMVCGTSIHQSPHREALQVSGLLHLMVVSGAHLHFLLSMLQHLPLSKRANLMIVTGYALISGWQAPCVRALIQLGLSSHPASSHFRSWQLVWMSGILTVLLFPSFAFGLSLLMSWICALVLSLLTRDKWLAAVGLYAMLFPVLLNWAPAHPFTIVLNVTIAPVVGFVALPLCLLSFALPPFAVVLDKMWGPFISLMERLVPLLRTEGSMPTDILGIYLCLALCHLIWEILYVSKQRTLACLRQPVDS